MHLIAERTFSVALCAWLKGQKRSDGSYPRRVISDCKSGSLLRRLHVLPIPHVISFFFPLLIAVKTSSLEVCIYYKPKSEHVVCAWDRVISELRNFIGWYPFLSFFPPVQHLMRIWRRSVGGPEIGDQRRSFAPPIVQSNNGKVFFTTATERYLFQCPFTTVCVLDGFEEENISPLVVVLSEGRAVFIYRVCFSWLIAERTPLLELSFSLKRYLWSLNSAGSLLGFQFFFSVQITAVKTSSVTLCASLS